MKYYIDESGNTGDISFTKNRLDFGKQPIFSLACIGINDLSALETKIQELKDKHNIRSNELKTTGLYKEKPKFIKDVFEFIESEKLPFFIEVVDKKYQLAVTIVNCYVMSPYFLPEEDEDSMFIRNYFADFIYHYFDDSIFSNFIEIFKEPSEIKVVHFFNILIDYLNSNFLKNEIAENILIMIMGSLDDYQVIKNDEGDNAYKRFLPIPDTNKKGLNVWILPHYASFTNIYARMNLYLNGNLSNVVITHDEQVHFDEIMKDAKISAESATKINKVMTPNSDFDFVESAELTFADSKMNIGIQVADLLAGFSSRFIYDFYSNNNHLFNLPPFLQPPSNRKICDDKQECMNILIRNSIPERGVGVNFVVSKVILNK